MSSFFVQPEFDVPTTLEAVGFRLEPLGAEHNERDHEAWVSSIEHIRSSPGFDAPDAAWPVVMSLEQNLRDVERHAADFAARTGFTYSVLDGDDVIGCVYIYPSKQSAFDAEVTSWVRASRSEMDGVVREAVAAWLEESWPFTNPRYARCRGEPTG